eukprot:scaffold329699_cov64-Tisochrysis_lutea.AAC.2
MSWVCWARKASEQEEPEEIRMAMAAMAPSSATSACEPDRPHPRDGETVRQSGSREAMLPRGAARIQRTAGSVLDATRFHLVTYKWLCCIRPELCAVLVLIARVSNPSSLAATWVGSCIPTSWMAVACASS